MLHLPVFQQIRIVSLAAAIGVHFLLSGPGQATGAEQPLRNASQVWRGKLDTEKATIRLRLELELKDGKYTGTSW